MKKLYVLYDERCELCKRLQEWLQGQRCWIELSMVPAGSPQAGAMFPTLDQIAGTNDLAVISESGEVYLNNHAWIMCLYALEEYRDWALRLSSPLLLPFARNAFAALSKNRGTISRWIGSSEHDLAAELRGVALGNCDSGHLQERSRSKPVLENNVHEYLR